MRIQLIRAALAASLTTVLAVAGSACNTAPIDIRDNNADVDINANVDIQADVDVDQLAPGDSIPLTLNAENVVLVEPNAQPPANQTKVAAHFRIYLDDFNSAPILITAQTKVSVQVPGNTPPGNHRLLCRLHKHDGTPLEVSSELSFTVVGTSTVTGP